MDYEEDNLNDDVFGRLLFINVNIRAICITILLHGKPIYYVNVHKLAVGRLQL